MIRLSTHARARATAMTALAVTLVLAWATTACLGPASPSVGPRSRPNDNGLREVGLPNAIVDDAFDRIRLVGVRLVADGAEHRLALSEAKADPAESSTRRYRASHGEHDVTVSVRAIPAPTVDASDPNAEPPVRGSAIQIEFLDEVRLRSAIETVALLIAIPTASASAPGRDLLVRDVDGIATPTDVLPASLIPVRRTDGGLPDLVWRPSGIDVGRGDRLPYGLRPRARLSTDQPGRVLLEVGLGAVDAPVDASGRRLTCGGALTAAAPSGRRASPGLLMEELATAFQLAQHVREPVPPVPSSSDPGQTTPPDDHSPPTPWEAAARHATAATRQNALDLADLLGSMRGVVGLFPARVGEKPKVYSTADTSRTWRHLLTVETDDTARERLTRGIRAYCRLLLASGLESSTIPGRFDGDFLEALEPAQGRDHDGPIVEGTESCILLLQVVDSGVLDPETAEQAIATAAACLRQVAPQAWNAAWPAPEAGPETPMVRGLGTPLRCAAPLAAAAEAAVHPRMIERLGGPTAATICHRVLDVLATLQDVAPTSDPQSGHLSTVLPAGAVRPHNDAAHADPVASARAARAFLLAFEAFGRPTDLDRGRAALTAAQRFDGLSSLQNALVSATLDPLQARIDSLEITAPRSSGALTAGLLAPSEVRRDGSWTPTVRLLDQRTRARAVDHRLGVELATITPDGPRRIALVEARPIAERGAAALDAAAPTGVDLRAVPVGGTLLGRIVAVPPGTFDESGIPLRPAVPVAPLRDAYGGRWRMIAVGTHTTLEPGHTPEPGLDPGDSHLVRVAGPGAERGREIPAGGRVAYRIPVPTARRIELGVEVSGAGSVRLRAAEPFVLHEDLSGSSPAGDRRTVAVTVTDRRAWPDDTLTLAIENYGEQPLVLHRLRWRDEHAAIDLGGVVAAESPTNPSTSEPTDDRAPEAREPRPTLRLAVVPVRLGEEPFQHGEQALRDAFFRSDAAAGTRRTPPPEPRPSAGSLTEHVQVLSGGTTTVRGSALASVSAPLLIGELSGDPEGSANVLLAAAGEALARAADETRGVDVVCIVHGGIGGELPGRTWTAPDDSRIPVVLLPAREEDGSILSVGRILRALLATIDTADAPDYASPELGRMGELALSSAAPSHLPPAPLGPTRVRLGWADPAPLLPIAPGAASPDTDGSEPIGRRVVLTPLESGRTLSILADTVHPGMPATLGQRQLVLEVRGRTAGDPGLVGPGVLAYWRLAPGDRPRIHRLDGQEVEASILRLSATRSTLDTPFFEGAATDLIGDRLLLDAGSQPAIAAFDGALAWTIEDVEVLETSTLGDPTATAPDRAVGLTVLDHRVDLLAAHGESAPAWWIDALGTGKSVRLPSSRIAEATANAAPRPGNVAADHVVRTPAVANAAMTLRTVHTDGNSTRRFGLRVRASVTVRSAPDGVRIALYHDGEAAIDRELRTDGSPVTLAFEVDLPPAGVRARGRRVLDLAIRNLGNSSSDVRIDALHGVPIAPTRSSLGFVDAAAREEFVGVDSRVYGRARAVRLDKSGQATYRVPTILADKRSALRLRAVRDAVADPWTLDVEVTVGGDSIERVAIPGCTLFDRTETGAERTLLVELPERTGTATGYLELTLRGPPNGRLGILDLSVVGL